MTNFADWEDTHFDGFEDYSDLEFAAFDFTTPDDDREQDGWSERDDFAELLSHEGRVAVDAWNDVSDDWRYRDACDYPPF